MTTLWAVLSALLLIEGLALALAPSHVSRLLPPGLFSPSGLRLAGLAEALAGLLFLWRLGWI